jgi:hypothetical protein
MYSLGWILTLFIRDSPLTFAVRVWDVFLAYGWSTFFSVALAVLYKARRELMKCTSFERCMLTLKRIVTMFKREKIFRCVRCVACVRGCVRACVGACVLWRWLWRGMTMTVMVVVRQATNDVPAFVCPPKMGRTRETRFPGPRCCMCAIFLFPHII